MAEYDEPVFRRELVGRLPTVVRQLSLQRFERKIYRVRRGLLFADGKVL